MSNTIINAVQGREALYSLYIDTKSNGKPLLRDRINQLKEDINWFDQTKELIRADLSACYDYTIHQFAYQEPSEQTSSVEIEKARRDYMIHSINRFVVGLLDEDQKSQSIKDYLMVKLMGKNCLNTFVYINTCSIADQNKGENALNKLFNKIQTDGNEAFLSLDQKNAKLAVKTKAPQETIKMETETQEKLPANKDPVSQPSSIKTRVQFHHTLQDIFKSISAHCVYSMDGKRLKQNLLAELTSIKDAIENGKDFSKLKLELIYSQKLKNITSDNTFFKIQDLGYYILAKKEATSSTKHIIDESSTSSAKKQIAGLPLEEMLPQKEVSAPDPSTSEKIAMPEITSNVFLKAKEKQIVEEEIVLKKTIVNEKTGYKTEKERPITEQQEQLTGFSWFLHCIKDFFLNLGNWFSQLWHKMFP